MPRMNTNITDLIEIFPWNDNFETGIKQIDEQHRVIVSLINQMASQLVHQPDTSSLDKIFTQLAEYAAYHFQCEELIWQQYLPQDSCFIEHQKTHELFITSVQELKQTESSRPLQDVIEDILYFLTQWLAHHILESDMRMSKIVLSMKAGNSFDDAIQLADKEMTGVLEVLLNTTLSMYENLCKRTLDLHREINERKIVEKKLRLASSVFDNTLEAICITDTNSVITDANSAFFESTGYKTNEIIGKHIGVLKSGLKDKKLIDSIWQQLNKEDHWNGEIKSRNKEGELQSEWLSLSAIKNNQNIIVHYVGIFSNISSLMKNQLELEYMAHHDALTKLPNRILLADRLEQAISRAKRNKQQFAVCFLDLDGFKAVNDIYGHTTGDQILCEIAQRIKKVIRGNDTVARVGGDEFVTLLTELDSTEDCKLLLNRLLVNIAKPITIQNTSHQVTASVGVALFPEHGNNPAKLLELSDQAMYIAKQLGKSRYQLHH